MHDSQRQESKRTLRLDKAPTGNEETVVVEGSFFKMLGEAIDEAFSSLGESAREAIYFHLEKSFGIKNSEIPYRIDDFSNAIEKIFGPGARHLEIMFMKNLYAKAKIDYPWDLPGSADSELTFAEYIRLAKQNWGQEQNGTSQRGTQGYFR
jgi:hypothetical protein